MKDLSTNCIIIVIIQFFSNRNTNVGAFFKSCKSLQTENNHSPFPQCLSETISRCEKRRKDYLLLKELGSAFQEIIENLKKRQEVSPRNCLDILRKGDNITGIRTIFPFIRNNNWPVSVFCDQTNDGGGWTIFQHRENLFPRENFFRNWTEYRLGFGKLDGEFWLGLENIHALVSGTLMEMRVDLEDYEGDQRWAKYDYFYIGTAEEKFRLDVGNYSGNAGDGIKEWLNRQMFSTPDQDNDQRPNTKTPCARLFKGAWWYNNCHSSNLNGLPLEKIHSSYGDGINWNPFRGNYYSLKKTSMAVRPKFVF